MNPIIVSFFTIETPYEKEARAMEATAQEFGLETDIRGVPNLGDWTHNCGQKPEFIRDRMLDYSGRPVVWLDADARVRRKPDLFDRLDCDVAFHLFRGEYLASGTLYFGPTPGAWALVQAWCAAQRHFPNEWDQRVLQSVVESPPFHDLRVYHLPDEYCAIFDAGQCPQDQFVIEHRQASRRLRAAVGI